MRGVRGGKAGQSPKSPTSKRRWIEFERHRKARSMGHDRGQWGTACADEHARKVFGRPAPPPRAFPRQARTSRKMDGAVAAKEAPTEAAEKALLVSAGAVPQVRRRAYLKASPAYVQQGELRDYQIRGTHTHTRTEIHKHTTCKGTRVRRRTWHIHTRMHRRPVRRELPGPPL